MMRRLLIGVVALLAFAGTAQASVPGHLVAHGTANGDFAFAYTTATFTRGDLYGSERPMPRALWARGLGKITHQRVSVNCTREADNTNSSRSLHHRGPGIWRVPLLAGADFCFVSIDADGGGGKIRVELRAA